VTPHDRCGGVVPALGVLSQVPPHHVHELGCHEVVRKTDRWLKAVERGEGIDDT
jgi:hypothetical protein